MFECVIPLPDALIRKPMDEPSKSLKHGDHDQSDHGNWAHGSGDGSKENPIRTNSVEDAARALGEGKHVELRTPDQVAVLLDRLNELAKEAEAAGTKAKNIDLCQLTVPGTNLFCVESKGIPRLEMPQLKGIPTDGSAASDLTPDKRGEVDITEAYLERLRSSGVPLTEDEALASHLKATQNELNGGKVAGIMAAARAGELDLNQPIVVSKDGYIVDGHHRWAAKVALEYDGIDDPETDMKIPVVRVDQDILEILESSKQFAADMGLPQMAVKSLKHGDHDQSDHGNWAHGNAAIPALSATGKKEGEKYLIERYPPEDRNRDSDLGKKLGLTSLEWAAADHYRTQGYMEMNNLLRGVGSDWGMEFAPADIRSVQLLDEAMDKSTIKNFETVYRGTSMLASKMENFLFDLKVGGVYTDPSFVSTSRGKDIAESFATDRPPDEAKESRASLMWEIVLPPGTSALDMQSLFPNFGSNEEEVLLDRDTHLRILAKESAGETLDGEPVYRIKAIAIPTTTKSVKHGDHDQSDHGNWATGGADHQYTGQPRSANSSKRMDEHTDRYGDPDRRESGRRSGSRNLGREVTYMEIVALESYKGGGYGEINRFLRGTQEGDDWTKDRIDAVKSLALPTTEPMTVTRMMPLFAVEGIAAGQVYEDKGFMSTGKGDHPAQFFHGYPVQMQIEVPAGTPVVDMDNFSGLDGWGNIEREVILMPDTQLIIDRVEQRDWNRDFGPNETDGLKVYARLVPATKSIKHADHDQSDHGNWADGSVPLAKTPIEQVDALRSWSSNSYNMINGALRNPDTLGSQERGGLREPVQKMQDQLDKLFAGVPKTTEEMTLYRGATGDWVKDLVDRYEATIDKMRAEYRETGVVPQFTRDRFTDLGFTSTSPDRDIAIRFSGTDITSGGVYTGEGRAIFEINIPEGSSVVNVEEFANEFGGFAKFAAEEKEYLLPRGSTFEVADVTPSEEQFGSQGPLYYTIKLDLVPSSTKSLKHADHDQSDHGNWAEKRDQIEKEDAERAKNDPWKDSPVSRSDAYASMAHYADFGYIPINRFLRGSDGDRPFSTKDKILQDVKNIDAMFTVATPLAEDLKVFRGVAYEQGSEMIVGRIFTDAGYTSTSRNAITPFGFMDETASRQYMMEITVPAGSKVAQVELSNEAETLLPRGSQFKITGLRNDGITIVEATLINNLKSLKHADHDQSDHGNWATGGGVLTRNAERFKAAGGTIDKPVKATDSPRSDYATPTGLYGGGSGVRSVIWHWDDLVNKAVAADDARTKAEEANMNLWETTKLDIESPEYEKESDKFQKAFEEANRLALGYKLTVDAITSTPFNEVIVARGADGSIVGALAYYMPPDNSQFTVQLLGSTHEVSGTGTALMREAMGIALDKGVPFQVLDPVEDAQPWYESLGLGPLQMSDGDVYHASKPLYRVEPDALREILGTTKSVKHGDHDQTDHGNWARGFDAPSTSVPSPANSTTTVPLWWHERDQTVSLDNMRNGMEASVREALDAYTHWSADDGYETGTRLAFHSALNEQLRAGVPRFKAVEAVARLFAEADDEELVAKLGRGFMDIDNALRDSKVKEDMMVTRASSPIMSIQELEAAAKGESINIYGQEIAPGAVYSDAGIISTSADMTYQSTQFFAQNWDSPEGLEDWQVPTTVRWNINLPSGAPALDLRALGFASQHGEDEVLLPRNTHFRIDGVDVQLPPMDGGSAKVTVSATVIPTHSTTKP
jgi:hypothetical protein